MRDPKLSNCRCGKHAVFQQGGSGGWYARCHYARCWYGPEKFTKEDAAEAWNAALRADAAGWVSVKAADLLAIRDAMARAENDEAYHRLYSMADPTFTKYTPWAEWERLAALPPAPEEAKP